jgi:hypothetical protein
MVAPQAFIPTQSTETPLPPIAAAAVVAAITIIAIIIGIIVDRRAGLPN